MPDLRKELLLLKTGQCSCSTSQTSLCSHACAAGALTHCKVIQSSSCSKLIASASCIAGDCMQVTVITATGEWKLHSLLLASRSEFFYRYVCTQRV